MSSTHFALSSPVSRLISQRFKSGTLLSGLDTGVEGGLDASWAQGGHPTASLTSQVPVEGGFGKGGKEAPEVGRRGNLWGALWFAGHPGSKDRRQPYCC